MVNQVSIDLRRYCPNNMAEAICNLSGTLYLGVERKQGESFEETLERIVILMRKLKEDYPGICSAKGIKYMFGQEYHAMEKRVAESGALGQKIQCIYPPLSNFGVMKEYYFGMLHALNGILSRNLSTWVYAWVTALNGEMTLTVGYCRKENSNEIKNFFELYLEGLPS